MGSGENAIRHVERLPNQPHGRRRPVFRGRGACYSRIYKAEVEAEVEAISGRVYFNHWQAHNILA
jgi:hypothetical protein